jgi:hypothetical protein
MSDHTDFVHLRLRARDLRRRSLIMKCAIDLIASRSAVETQYRFKRAVTLIHLFQNAIPQIILGDFCNTIGPKAKSAYVRCHVWNRG